MFLRLNIFFLAGIRDCSLEVSKCLNSISNLIFLSPKIIIIRFWNCTIKQTCYNTIIIFRIFCQACLKPKRKQLNLIRPPCPPPPPPPPQLYPITTPSPLNSNLESLTLNLVLLTLGWLLTMFACPALILFLPSLVYPLWNLISSSSER